MPAQVQTGVYPLGADVRYLFSSDGRTILAKRTLHNALIESGRPPANGKKPEMRVHTAVLDDIPEDTDVFHVMVRQPAVREYVLTGAFVYVIYPTGEIRLAGRTRDVLGDKAKGPQGP